MEVRAIIMGVIFAFMWSSAFSSARIIVAYAPPLGTLSLRFLISGLIGILIAFSLGQNLKLTKEQWRSTIIFGIFQNAVYLGLNFYALQWIEASLASIIASSMPLMVALCGWVIFREKLNNFGTSGLFLGFFGVILIMGVRVEAGGNFPGIVFCILGAVGLTTATLMVRSASSGENVMMIIGLQMIIGSICLGVVSLATETFEVAWNWSLILAFTYTTFVPGLAATIIWFKLVNLIGAVKASAFHFLNPFFGVIVAAIILEERIRLIDFLGVVIIMLGILAVQLSKQKNQF